MHLLTRTTRRLGLALAAAALAACSTDDLLTVTDPDVIDPSAVNSPAAAEALRIGALSRLNTATSGNESFHILGGLLGDEFRSGDTFAERNEADRRSVTTSNALVRGAFRDTYRARVSALQAVDALREYGGEDWKIAQMYVAAAYAENLLAESACSGIPISDIEGAEIKYGAPKPTADVYALALAHADTALAMLTGTTADDVAVRRAAQVLRGRILLNTNRPADAAAAVSGVPTEFEFRMEHSQTTATNTTWGLNNAAGRYILGGEPGGFDFAAARDPRVPACLSGAVRDGAAVQTTCPAGTAAQAFDAGARTVPFYVQLAFPARESAVPIISGVEARLIEAEAALRANNGAGFIAIHNALRARVTGLEALPLPAGQTAREDLHFRERALWLFGRGYRLGDMRRLVRQYNRPAASVFPSGSWFKGGEYGSDVNFPIPQAEENNPEFPAGQACIDRNA